MAMWLIDPPMSLTAALMRWKIGLQVGLVTWQTRMSPCWMRPISSTDFTTRAVPSTTPEHAAKPFSSLVSSLPSLSQESRLSRVMPHSITIAGSSITSGTAPSAGEVGCLAHSAIAALRSATTAGQCFGPRASAPLPQASIRSMIALSTSYCVRWKMSSSRPSGPKKPWLASSAPNSLILLKNRLVYQCSQ